MVRDKKKKKNAQRAGSEQQRSTAGAQRDREREPAAETSGDGNQERAEGQERTIAKLPATPGEIAEEATYSSDSAVSALGSKQTSSDDDGSRTLTRRERDRAERQLDQAQFDPKILDRALSTPGHTTRRSIERSSSRTQQALPTSCSSSSALAPAIRERLNARVQRELGADGELSAEGLAIVAALAGGYSTPTIPAIIAPATSTLRMGPRDFEDSMKYDGDPKKLSSFLSQYETLVTTFLGPVGSHTTDKALVEYLPYALKSNTQIVFNQLMHNIVPWRKSARGDPPLADEDCKKAPENWDEVKLAFCGYFLPADVVQHLAMEVVQFQQQSQESANDAMTRYRGLWAEFKAVLRQESQTVDQALEIAILEHGLLPHLAQRQRQYDFATTIQEAENRIRHSEAYFSNPDQVAAATVASVSYSAAPRQPARARPAHRSPQYPAPSSSPSRTGKRSLSRPPATSSSGNSVHTKNKTTRRVHPPKGSNSSKRPAELPQEQLDSSEPPCTVHKCMSPNPERHSSQTCYQHPLHGHENQAATKAKRAKRTRP